METRKKKKVVSPYAGFGEEARDLTEDGDLANAELWWILGLAALLRWYGDDNVRSTHFARALDLLHTLRIRGHVRSTKTELVIHKYVVRSVLTQTCQRKLHVKMLS